jgi:hypothetical protein
LLVAGHLFLLANTPARLKVIVIGVACGATVVHVAAPWLVMATDGAVWAVLLFPLSGGSLLLSFAALLGWPTWEMWSYTTRSRH